MLKPFDFAYTHAIVCRVPNSFKDATFRQKEIRKLAPVDITLAKEHHNEYIATLRRLGLDVIELQADEQLPDSIFVDCVAVVCDGSALIAKPHLVSRRKEAEIIKCYLRKEGLNIIEISDPIATIDGSDVLFTGREFFVALTKHTNIFGAKALASAFPDWPVSSIRIKKGLHLKAYVSVVGPDLLAFSSSEIGKDLLRQMKEIAEYKNYKIITIPDDGATNAIYINGTLLHCAQEEWPNSYDAFASKVDYPRIEIRNNEFSKVDRYLSCRCLLFTKNKLFNLTFKNLE